MTINYERLIKTLIRFDQVNEQDPNQESYRKNTYPKEWLYAHRMSEMLHIYEQSPSETLQLAVRSQHIGRWEIPRDEYPKGKQGYLKWRTKLKLLHAQKAEEIMRLQKYEPETIQKVKDLLIKKGLKTDPETQALEDIICLVFLKYYFGDFVDKHDEEKILDILRKTWAKMTEKGQKMALELNLQSYEVDLIHKALEL